MTRELAEEEFCPHRSEPTEKRRQFQRSDSVQTEHLYRLRIVAEHHRAAVAGPPPQALLAESCLPVVKIQPDISVKKLELVYRRYRRSRRLRDSVDASYG